MSSKTIFLFFSLSLLLTGSLLSVQPADSAVSSFFWLKPGTYAVYSFPDGMLGFDDHGWANPVRGNYSWLCLEKNDTHAILDVEVNIEVFQRPEWVTPGAITYKGFEFLERAASGDLSFIKRVPMYQVIGRIELDNCPGEEYYAVRIPSPINISKKFKVVVDLDTMMMIGEDGEPWGRWALWIDPLKYPLEGETEELFIMNWLNTTINLNVGYKVRPNSSPIDTVLGDIKRHFYAWCDPIENEFLLELASSPFIILTYFYESRTGIFLEARTSYYLDDVLTQKFGIIKTNALHNFFYLIETNVSIEESPPSDFNLSPYIPHLIILGIAATIAAAYIIRHKKLNWKSTSEPSNVSSVRMPTVLPRYAKCNRDKSVKQKLLNSFSSCGFN